MALGPVSTLLLIPLLAMEKKRLGLIVSLSCGCHEAAHGNISVIRRWTVRLAKTASSFATGRVLKVVARGGGEPGRPAIWIFSHSQ